MNTVVGKGFQGAAEAVAKDQPYVGRARPNQGSPEPLRASCCYEVSAPLGTRSSSRGPISGQATGVGLRQDRSSVDHAKPLSGGLAAALA